MGKECKHRVEQLFGNNMSIVTIGNQDYLIGVVIANLLQRETFNMYRSMKIKGIKVKRADPSQVDYLTICGAVRPGTHSVTLIPIQDAMNFISEAWERKRTEYHKPAVAVSPNSSEEQISDETYPNAPTTTRNYLCDRSNAPKSHRRKPFPWDVHRSLSRESSGPEFDFYRYSTSQVLNTTVPPQPGSTYQLPKVVLPPVVNLPKKEPSPQSAKGPSLVPLQSLLNPHDGDKQTASSNEQWYEREAEFTRNATNSSPITETTDSDEDSNNSSIALDPARKTGKRGWRKVSVEGDAFEA